MNKKYFKWIALGVSGVIVCCLLLVIFFRKAPNGDVYAPYTCKDYHLVCLNSGEYLGENKVKISDLPCTFKYNAIAHCAEEEFVAAWMKINAPFNAGENMVLQGPENDLDVLNDWTIKKVILYYYDINDKRNPDAGDRATAEDYHIVEIAEVEDEALFQEILEMKLNTTPKDGTCIGGDYHLSYDSTLDDKHVYLRIFFEESDSIAWDSEIDVYESKEIPAQFMVTINKGSIDSAYQKHKGGYIVEPSSSLYRFILNGYMKIKN